MADKNIEEIPKEEKESIITRLKEWFEPKFKKMDALEEQVKNLGATSNKLVEEGKKVLPKKELPKEEESIEDAFVKAQLKVNSLKEEKEKEMKLLAEYELLEKDIPVESKNLLATLVEGVEDISMKIAKVKAFKGQLGAVDKVKENIAPKLGLSTGMDIREDLIEFAKEEMGWSEDHIKKVTTDNFLAFSRKQQLAKGLSGNLDSLQEVIDMYKEK